MYSLSPFSNSSQAYVRTTSKSPKNNSQQLTFGADSVLNTELDRRTVLRGIGGAGLLGLLGSLGGDSTHATTGTSHTPQQPAEVTPQALQKDLEHIAEEPFSQKALEGLLAFSFVDGMTALGRETDSVLGTATSWITNMNGCTRPEAFKHSLRSLRGKLQDDPTAYPHANMLTNLAVNGYFMSGALGPAAQKHAIQEMAGTTFAVSFLAEKALLAKGIKLNDAAMKRFEKDAAGHDRAMTDPEGVIADVLFQLTVLAVPPQLILYAFGNSRLGVNFAPLLTKAVKEGLYGENSRHRLDTTSLDALEASLGKPKKKEISSILRIGGTVGQTETGVNPEVNIRVYDYLAKLTKEYKAALEKTLPANRRDEIEGLAREMLKADFGNGQVSADVIELKRQILRGKLDHRSMRQRLQTDVANEMIYDGVMGIMATGVNSAQTWCGDLGPLLGTTMKHGPINGAAIAFANFPYSYADALLHVWLMAQRFGIPANRVFTKDNLRTYQAEYLKNNAIRVLTLANTIQSGLRKVPVIGTRIPADPIVTPLTKNLNPAMESTIREALKVGNIKVFNTLSEAVAIMADRKGNNAAAGLSDQEVRAEFDKLVAELRESRQEDPHRFNEGARRLFHQDVPLDANTKHLLREIEEQVLADAPNAQANGKHIADQVNSRMNELIQNGKAMARDFSQWEQDLKKGHPKPLHDEELKVRDFLNFLQASDKKKWYQGFSYKFWEDRTSQDFASLLYFVALQGTSLTGLIPTINRTVYQADWFKNLPLSTRELISVMIHRITASLADNWTDNQVANDNHAVMYSEETYNRHLQDVSERYFKKEGSKANQALWDGFFDNKSPSYFTITRYRQMVQKTLVLFDLLENDPKCKKKFLLDGKLSKKQLEAIKKQSISDLNAFYWRGAELAHVCSVSGGGETVAGNAPNFPLALAYGLSLGRSMKDIYKYLGTYFIRTAEMYGNGKYVSPHIAAVPAQLGVPGFFSPSNYAQEIQGKGVNRLKNYDELKQELFALAA